MSYESAQAHYDASLPGSDRKEHNEIVHNDRVVREELLLLKYVDDSLDAVLEYLKVLPEIEEALDVLTTIVDAAIHAPFNERYSPINTLVTMAIKYKATKLVAELYEDGRC
jgi:hypothetical protein